MSKARKPGHVRKVGGVYYVVISLGYEVDPETGKKTRKQRWVKAGPKWKDATDKQTELENAKKEGSFVEPSKITVGEWLDSWFETAIAPNKRPRTVETYQSVLDHHLKPALGAIGLQKLEAADIERYFTERKDTLSPSTLSQHSAILHSALKSAERKKKVQRNVHTLVENKPKREADTRTDEDGNEEAREEVIENVWEDHEAKRFLAVAKDVGPQQAAFYGMLLELGLRKGEICGLRWKDVSLERAKVQIARQLVKVGNRAKERAPLYGPPKNGNARTLDISRELVGLLAAHKRHQAEVKMRNREAYKDQGLVFAKEDRRTRDECLGDPIQANNIAQREFDPLIEKAEVKRIKFHGLRHTSATLALQNGVAPKVVQQRLGHKRIEITLNIYSHALGSAQKDAASRMGSLLHS